MKKVFWLITLSTLLSSCAMNYESFKNDRLNSYKFFAESCPQDNINVVEGCGFGASNESQQHANSLATEVCDRTYTGCVITKEGNRRVYTQENYQNQQNEVKMASMIDKAKDTCKSLGFRQGTDKFTDCSLKLYTQEMELAAKNNQQVVIQGQTSGTMTIYDPVRDSDAMIRRGQSLLNGSCNLANYYSC
jgi:hypothetical protein